MSYDTIRMSDPELYGAMKSELERQRDHIELIASENFTSRAVMEAMGSHLTNKYAEGYPGARYYGGCEYVDIVEQLAIDRAKALFGAEHANVQPHSGSQANVAVYLALLKPGDTILGMDLSHGGHLTHGSKASISGKYFNACFYGVDPETEMIDYEKAMQIAGECKPKLIIAGASAYSRIIDFKKMREIADEVGAYLMVDMAHIAGLVAGGQHQSPVPYADVVTTTTHKTLRGPRGGVILAKAEWAKRIDSAVFPGMQGGPLLHIIAGKAVCFREAMEPAFRDYARRTVENAAALANALRDSGFDLVSGGTDNHLMLVDLRSHGITGRDLQERLDGLHITLNKNAIPGDPEKPMVTSGVRIGTPCVTTRGFGSADMETIARCIHLACRNDPADRAFILDAVRELTERYPMYKG